ncbi:MAG: DUF4261 domain-containing protein [Planctomycetia bacterium]|nr:DUF4261 domain-containing protein [Planctomycetia bacterium]
MLGWLFKSKPAPPPEPGPQFCMVALPQPATPDAAAVAKAFRAVFPGKALDIVESDPEAMQFRSGDVPVMATAIPLPIPAGDIEAAAARSWMWPQAAAAMRSQRGHVIVAAIDNASAREAAIAVSRVAGAMAHAGKAVGIYWGNSGQIHRPDMFVEMVRDLDPPLPLWVGIVISARSREGPFTLSTCGLRSLGHKELEIIDTHLGIGDLRGTVFDISNYLLDNGPVLEHGHTFGRSPAEKWKVEHTTSKFREGEPVIRLHIP